MNPPDVSIDRGGIFAPLAAIGTGVTWLDTDALVKPVPPPGLFVTEPLVADLADEPLGPPPLCDI